MAKLQKKDILSVIEGMTIVELNELVKAIEEKFGVSAAMPMAFAAGGAPASAGEAEEVEQTEFDVVLKDPGEKKIHVIKAVRDITGLGLKEAKALVDAAPKAIKAKLPKNEAEDLKAKLEDVGAIVELK